MRSSTGKHFIALDHVRALAIFMVFSWHFTHGTTGNPIPFNYVPSVFIFSLLDEGHTGVALFITLSGYLFAKLLDGRRIYYSAFFLNRFLRLAPLLVIVILLVGLQHFHFDHDLHQYAESIIKGALFPCLPNGGWSITVEIHFYVLLPLFLWLSQKSKASLIFIVLTAIILRSILYHARGEVQSFAFLTIVGRIDQFLLGMFAFQNRNILAKRHVIAIGSLIAFSLFYWYFDLQGGFYKNNLYPSPSPLWIILPTLEGITYALGIAYYENSFSPSNNGISKLIGRIGTFSYSIYLIHFFGVFQMAPFINERLMNISNYYLAYIWSVICFLLMIPIGYLSFRFIETPFLKLRTSYTIETIDTKDSRLRN